MAMKKPMKRTKRYEGGGEIMGEMDPMEAAAKKRGLEMSNKEAPVGFFERIRMGNIDQPGTEAYNRFGAGRGRVAPAAEEDRPMPVARPPAQPNPIFAAGLEQGKRQPSGDASVAEDYAGPRTKPIVTAPVKPTASKPVASAAPAAPMKTVGTGNQRGPTAEELAAYAAEKNKKPSAAAKMDVPGMKEKAKNALDADPTALLGAAGAAGAGYGLYRLAKNMLGGTKVGKVAAPFLKEIGTNPASKRLEGPRKLLEGPRPATKASEVTDVVPKSAPSRSLTGPAREDAKAAEAYDKLTKSNFVKKPKKPLDESDTTGGAIGYKRGGKTKKYASGGMVSSASKRADGIASKGKTRCKIC